MRLRPSVARFAFDAESFSRLRDSLVEGSLDPALNRLQVPPEPLRTASTDLRDLSPARREELRTAGREAIAGGRVGALIMNGGMATRFGGGAKGVVSVVPGRPSLSFLAVKLGDVAGGGARVPAAVMCSFATMAASHEHLDAIDWAGVGPDNRFPFEQSIMPRVLADGTPAFEADGADALADTQIYAAPGHGDTLPRVRRSGVLERLRARGVEHVLVSNVDNLGATLDPVVVGAHLQSVGGGAAITVEVVRRNRGDAGGVIARLPDSRLDAIIEGFRLPSDLDLGDYPFFNTNTLWFTVEALARPLPLTWFAVHKTVQWGDGASREIVQFEQLIGQATELLPAAYVEVDRDARFLPIKTRDDLAENAGQLTAFARSAGLLDPEVTL